MYKVTSTFKYKNFDIAKDNLHTRIEDCKGTSNKHEDSNSDISENTYIVTKTT